MCKSNEVEWSYRPRSLLCHVTFKGMRVTVSVKSRKGGKEAIINS